MHTTLRTIGRLSAEVGIGCLSAGRIWGVLALVMALSVGGPSWGQVGKPAGPAPVSDAASDDGPVYTVSRFIVRYAKAGHPQQPGLDNVMELPIGLNLAADGYIAPRGSAGTVVIRLSQFTEAKPGKFHASAIRAIDEAIVSYYNRMGLVGVFVLPDPKDIHEGTLDDLRATGVGPDKTALHLIIHTTSVRRVRTVVTGEDAPSKGGVDNTAHSGIKERSPLQAGTEGEAEGDLLSKDALDNYIFLLNRYPGRRVDATISAGELPDQVVLDFLVNEVKPWLAYFQMSNTGTKQTSRWREAFGFVDNQLTGHNDILSVNYSTASFEASHAVSGAYELPLLEPERIRLRLFGDWSRYDASQVGIVTEKFTGKDWDVGGELIANMYQHRDLFVDVLMGARWKTSHVDNSAAMISGTASFFLPKVGMRLERLTAAANTTANVSLETNMPKVANTRESDLNTLGRLNADTHWSTLAWDLRQSFYLEPLLSDDRDAVLAHEMNFSFRGQYAFDNRLVPQFEEVIGGFYTVRGYPESSAVGDSALIGSAEYAYHWPRTLSPREQPVDLPLVHKPFRAAPQVKSGRPDWDLILRAFFDAGRTINSHPSLAPNEKDATMFGTGVGAELQIFRNLSLRCDWGIALKGTQQTTTGDNRFHLIGTFSF